MTQWRSSAMRWALLSPLSKLVI